MANPFDLIPPHEAHEEDRVLNLMESIENRGWDGPSLLVEGTHGALTGSHRIEAARRLGLRDIPTTDVREAIVEHGGEPADFEDGWGQIDTEALSSLEDFDKFGVEF